MGSHLRIDLLGALRVRRGEQSVTRFPQRCGHLLAYLAYFPRRPHTRELLADTLWPESAPDVARSNLRVSLHTLREQLAPLDDPDRPLLIADWKSARLDPDAFTTDLAEWRNARAAARQSVGAERAERLAAAADLYHDELLCGFYEEWVLAERLYLLEQQIEVLGDAVAALEESGDLNRALEYARRAVSADPLREEAHHTLMRLYAATGQPSAVLRQYQELERCLREELGDTPSAETRALAEELRQSARTIVTARSASRPPAPDPRSGELQGRDPGVSGRTASLGRVAALPPQFTRFFGRDEEIACVVRALGVQEMRLVTLTGPGGSGKTRLAIAAAGRLSETIDRAIVYVPLTDLTEGSRIPDALAVALRLPPSPHTDRLEEVVEALEGQRCLLVLDNFEHLLPDGALVVRSLLVRVPALACLVTSRQRLNLTGEQEFVVLPLPTPRRSDALERLMEFASIQLFLDRARAVRADFQIPPGDAAVMAEVCDRLEGLPLALELAAARMAVLTPRQLLAQLERRFEILVGRQRDVPRRHQSLRAAIESSYRLLDPRLRQFFARLSVFRGGWTLEAARAVCNAPDALDALQHLRDCSLLAPVEEHAAEARYRLLETLREFAWEQLVASGEVAAVRDLHRDWFLQLAEQVDAESVRSGRGPALWARLEAELDNFRAALAWCQEAADADRAGCPLGVTPAEAAEAGLRLAYALYDLWYSRGHLAEGQRWLEGALARSPEAPAGLRARTLLLTAHVAHSRSGRDWQTLLNAARRELERAVELARRDGDRRQIALALALLAEVTYHGGDLDEMWRVCEEARQRFEELGDALGLAGTLEWLGGIALQRGDRPAARPLLEERLALCRKLGRWELLIHALGGLGHLERDEGRYDRARALYQESLVRRREAGHQIALVQSLEDFAVLAGREQQAERAIRLLGAAEAFCETLGARPPVAVVQDYEQTVDESRAALGEAAFARAWAAGRAMPLEEAIREALEAPAASDPSVARAGPGEESTNDA